MSILDAVPFTVLFLLVVILSVVLLSLGVLSSLLLFGGIIAFVDKFFHTHMYENLEYLLKKHHIPSITITSVISLIIYSILMRWFLMSWILWLFKLITDNF